MDNYIDKQELNRWISELVWSMRESSQPWSWDDLSEAEKAGIDRGMADLEAGRTTTNEEVWKKIEEKFGYKSRFLDKK